MDKKCDCTMFQNRGYCYHVGFLGSAPKELRAVSRMKERLLSKSEEKEKKHGYIQKG